ncbi:MAG TPA: zinc ribbon domain-containing protein [Candidatus Sumerlaeota bacterium]|nr:zinc ribbon domain-containing protein [Candidatus Sumerlaeota bacterium]
MQCPQCHSVNANGALACTMCGAPLGRRLDTDPALPGAGADDDIYVGPSYKLDSRVAHDPNELKRRSALASRFLLLATPLFLALMAGIQFRAEAAAYLRDMLQLEALTPTQFLLILAGTGIVLNAMLIYYSARAAGGNGLLAAAVALAPPLIPAGYALLARRRFWMPYVCLLVDGLILAAAWFIFTNYAWLTLVLFLLMIPVIAYHLSGCAAVDISLSLGLLHYLSVAWVCLGPAVLAGWCLVEIGVMDLLANSLADGTHFPSLSEIGRQVYGQIGANPDRYQMALLVWLGVILLVWIKSVYENLKFPVIHESEQAEVWTTAA